MIDFTIGAILGALAVYAYFHFKGETPAKALSDFSNLENRIRTMISDALNELKANVDADKAKAVAEAVAAMPVPDVAAAQAAQESADEQAVRDFTAANFPPAV